MKLILHVDEQETVFDALPGLDESEEAGERDQRQQFYETGATRMARYRCRRRSYSLERLLRFRWQKRRVYSGATDADELGVRFVEP
jgi:hypothetical protein